MADTEVFIPSSDRVPGSPTPQDQDTRWPERAEEEPFRTGVTYRVRSGPTGCQYAPNGGDMQWLCHLVDHEWRRQDEFGSLVGPLL